MYIFGLLFWCCPRAPIHCRSQLRFTLICLPILSLLEGPGILSMSAPVPPWPAVPEKRRLFGSLWGKSPGRPSSLETSTTCVPAGPLSLPAPCLNPEALPPQTRWTRRLWKDKHTGMAPPASQCFSRCAACCYFPSGVRRHEQRRRNSKET